MQLPLDAQKQVPCCVPSSGVYCWLHMTCAVTQPQGGIGEASCLAMCSFYDGRAAITLWSSGTGMAGVKLCDAQKIRGQSYQYDGHQIHDFLRIYVSPASLRTSCLPDPSCKQLWAKKGGERLTEPVLPGVAGYTWVVSLHLLLRFSFKATLLVANATSVAWLLTFHLLLPAPVRHLSIMTSRVSQKSSLCFTQVPHLTTSK